MRFDSIQLSSEQMVEADLAVVFYGEHGLATLHPVGWSGDSRRICEGQFLDRADMAALGRIFSQHGARESLILPERVLGIGSDFLTWYRPAEKRPMYFVVDGVREKVDVFWPSMIFHAKGDRLFAVAYCAEGRPAGSTPVYLPPLANFWDSTEMCRGQAAYPKGWGPETVPEWEHAVYGTYFTHINGSVKLAGRPNSTAALLAYWKHPARGKHPVKREHLVPVSWAPDCSSWLHEVSHGGWERG